jgi:hypothetical protein
MERKYYSGLIDGWMGIPWLKLHPTCSRQFQNVQPEEGLWLRRCIIEVGLKMLRELVQSRFYLSSSRSGILWMVSFCIHRLQTSINGT